MYLGSGSGDENLKQTHFGSSPRGQSGLGPSDTPFRFYATTLLWRDIARKMASLSWGLESAVHKKKCRKSTHLENTAIRRGVFPNEFLIVCKTISVGLGTFGGGVHSEWVRHNFKYSTYLGRKIAQPKGTFINLRNWKLGLECGRSVRLRQKISTKPLLSGWYLDEHKRFHLRSGWFMKSIIHQVW